MNWFILFMLFTLAFFPKSKPVWRSEKRLNRINERNIRIKSPIIFLHGKVVSALEGSNTGIKTYYAHSLICALVGAFMGGYIYLSFAVSIVLALGFVYLYYLNTLLIHGKNKRAYNLELESYMSLVTNSYLRSASLIIAVRDNVPRFKKEGWASRPFFTFHKSASFLNASQVESIMLMEREGNNQLFKRWCKRLELCQRDSALRYVLPPLVNRMRHKRNIDSEIQSLLARENKVFLSILILSGLLLFGIPIIQPDLRAILLGTKIGSYLIIGGFMVIFASCGTVVRANSLTAKDGNNMAQELPEFAAYIMHSYPGEQDLMTLATKYLPAAGESLRDELLLLIADLKTGNQDQAILSFDLRCNLPPLSNFLNALRSVVAGESSLGTMERVALDLELYERDIAMKKAGEVPGKIERAGFMVVATVAVYLIVLFGLFAFNVGKGIV